MSIRDTKDKLQNYLKRQINFHSLYNNIETTEMNITPSLCFLTLLHLANENNLNLKQENDCNFMIKK